MIIIKIIIFIEKLIIENIEKIESIFIIYNKIKIKIKILYSIKYKIYKFINLLT
jgi:hypothetical protein